MARIRGDRELRQNLRSIGDGVTGKDLDALCIDALQPMHERVVALAPRPSLKRDAVIRKRESSGRFRRVFWISFVNMGRRVAHLVEFGTQPHSLFRGASVRKGLFQDRPPFHPGQRAEPFMRPAFEGTKGEVAQAFGRGLMARIARTVRGVRK